MNPPPLYSADVIRSDSSQRGHQQHLSLWDASPGSPNATMPTYSDGKAPFHMQELDGSATGSAIPADSDLNEGSSEQTIVDLGSDIGTLPRLNFSEWTTVGRGLASSARMLPDGRIAISLDLKEKLPDLSKDYGREVKEFAVDERDWKAVPKMNIVIMIVGSRGDVQPYVALGKLLRADGHRVRIASHETFRGFVKEHDLEFYDIGGNPQDLMSYMVKNPGLIPGFESMRNGDIGRKRTMLTEMINGCWLACHSPDSETGRSFAADAIISNPPAFAHIHCAEALGIPLLMSFTMPWCATTAFNHPLVNVSKSNAEVGLTNVLTYALADILTWQGTGDIINKFRAKSLGLAPLELRSGPGVLERTRVPWTYCMSPGLVPKPSDWKKHIDVVGFYFLDLATNYTPEPDLAKFLSSGEPPIYIGFGSIVIEDPEKMTKTIFDATQKVGVRALVSAGWGGLGNASIPSHIFILGNVPHDWLFSENRVKAVIHHGGAGTTAIGLAKGRPTAVVPFFGDQEFWGQMIHKAGAGPEPIPHKSLNVDKLTNAIKYLVSESASSAARRLEEQIRAEDGVKRGLESFYRHLPLLNMRCDLDPSRIAVWWSTEHCLKLSNFAAQVLADARQIKMDELEPHRSKDYETRKQATDPVTGGSTAIFWTVTHYYAGIAQIFYSPVKGIINTTIAIPKGVMKIVLSVHEGFQNAPKLYGSKVRKPEKVKDLTSGIAAAGKSVFYGYYDGITGLVIEPYKGAKKEGFMGFVKGSARSYVNATMRPAAGIVGAMVYPFEGAWKQAQSTVAKKVENRHQETRRLDGIEQVKSCTPKQREEIIRKFNEAKGTTKQRQKTMTETAEKVLAEEKANTTTEETQEKPYQPDSQSLSSSSTGETVVEHDKSRSPSTPVATPGSGSEDPDADAAFERDLELAKQISLAEQRGYERGLASQSNLSKD